VGVFLVVFASLLGVAHAVEAVNVDTVNRAEIDNCFKKYADDGYFGSLNFSRFVAG
jgi:hypothetical protein